MNKKGNLEMRQDEIFIANRSGNKPKTTKNQHKNVEFTRTIKLKHTFLHSFFIFPHMVSTKKKYKAQKCE